MANCEPICCFVEFGGKCNGEKKHRLHLPASIVSRIEINSGVVQFENVCKFHKERLAYNDNKKCIDPFKKHGKSGATSVSKVNSVLRHSFERKFPRDSLVIGDPLCKRCYSNFLTYLDNIKNPFDDTPNTKLNTILKPLNIQMPTRISNKSNKRKRCTSLNIVKEKINVAVNDMFDVKVVDDEEENEDDEEYELFKDIKPMKGLIEQLKIKLDNTTNYADKVQLLTLAPPHWSRPQCMKYFEVTDYLVRKARTLNLLEKPAPRKGNGVPQSEIDLIIALYNEQSIDRPEMNQTISVRGENGVVLIGKKLLSMTVDELYKEYVVNCKEVRLTKPIGRAKFFQLRPKHIVIADKYAHSYCVCIYHQNVRLLVDSLDVPTGWEKFWYFKSLVCDTVTYECAVGKCRNCPGNNNLRAKLNELILPDEMITYQQWVNGSLDGSRCALKTLDKSSEDFIVEFLNQMKKFKLHHFTWLEQKSFLKNATENAKKMLKKMKP